MKKSARTKTRSTVEKNSAATAVEKYLARVPDRSRQTFQQLRDAVNSALPSGSVEVISYGILGFKKEKVIVWIGAFANHCSLFPGGSVTSAMKDELKSFTTSKGTIQFPIDKPVSRTLVRKIVKARLVEG